MTYDRDLNYSRNALLVVLGANIGAAIGTGLRHYWMQSAASTICAASLLVGLRFLRHLQQWRDMFRLHEAMFHKIVEENREP